ncbi:MAG: NAD-dependent epimerase/dehydratase family protein [Planctomycetes bacterium]|nr:NAD-dependent epimerase/dehydratase family protein [Planctomycetota bacterium]
MRALVTGGGGFLGGALVRALRGRGVEVRSFARGDYPELRRAGVDVRRGDLADARAVSEAVAGCDAVFHAGAKAGIWGRARDYHDANVAGTQNVLAACAEHGVRRLIYTSTPSVVFAGVDQRGIDEGCPYPRKFLAHYPRTKAIAERMVLGANGAKLATVALRPHLIWGPDDNHLVPRLVERARAGRLRLVAGGQTQIVDSIYVDNAAAAHLLAAERMEPGAPIAGKAYFLSQGEPLPIATLINRILACAGLPPVTRSISARAAHAAGTLCEFAYGALGLRGEPPMTRFLARQLATSHWFDIGAARRDLGYEPEVSIEEGLARLAAWFRKSAAAASAAEAEVPRAKHA